MPSKLIIECSKTLRELGLTIAFAESATAGRIASEFSLTEHSGSILKGGLVCYDAEVKTDVLGIDPVFIQGCTAESKEVTQKLATRLRNLIRSDIQVGVTGLTTPGGSETKEKPVGTIFIHFLVRDRSIAVREVFYGFPEEIVLSAADLAASTLIKELTNEL
ncbi:CinA family protein [Dyadobacter sp. CY312]|uniref:CinA family protein n=1 Tax=Dyadobacter sp. CY312 TaxID=2907303 RepID=UPI001F308817|nr:nicotinamide-nucleotide amidohydrolase family protein [Dyadobacter sp. CY312]MCE7039087.1 nicotinamide-nucleotide amidohydrolase family protein [Dyadobacter sp. CY312]